MRMHLHATGEYIQGPLTHLNRRRVRVVIFGNVRQPAFVIRRAPLLRIRPFTLKGMVHEANAKGTALEPYCSEPSCP